MIYSFALLSKSRAKDLAPPIYFSKVEQNFGSTYLLFKSRAKLWIHLSTFQKVEQNFRKAFCATFPKSCY